MDKIVNAGIRITKKCDFNCPYCNIRNSMKKDMPFERVIKSLEIIKKLGANNLVLLGGEPTLYPYINEVVDYAENNLDIRCSLTTNAYNNTEDILKLIDNGLSQIGVSVDCLDFRKSISPLKCKCGLELIEVLNQKSKINGKKFDIIDYVVINNSNLETAVELVKEMTKKNVYTYFLPFHWGNSQDFEHRKEHNKNAIILKKDIEKFKNLMAEFAKMKKNGYLIKNSIEFLKCAQKHIEKLDWKCSGLSELRIDSDGSMACCCDKLGEVNKKFTIFDLQDEKIFQEFLLERNNDATRCKGCLWPSSFEAQNLRDGKS